MKLPYVFFDAWFELLESYMQWVSRGLVLLDEDFHLGHIIIIIPWQLQRVYDRQDVEEHIWMDISEEYVGQNRMALALVGPEIGRRRRDERLERR